MSGAYTFNRLCALLNALMLASLVLVLGGVVQRFVAGWQPLYLALACLLIALETAFVSFTVRRDRMWANESMRYLVAEIAVLIALTRVVATLSLGVTSLRTDAQRWLLYPLSAVTDGPFLVCFIVGLLVGMTTYTATRDLMELSPQEFEGRVQAQDDYMRVYMLANQDRAAALRRINRRFIIGGALLLIGLSVQVVNMTNATGPTLAIPPAAAGSALVYVITGFILYSQACLALLQSRWNIEHATVEPNVLRRWTRGSVLLIGGLAVLMLALPRSYGIGLLDTLRTTMGFLGATIIQIGYILLWLLSMLAMLPLLLFSWLMPGNTAAPTPLPPPPPIIPATPEVPGTPPLLPSLIFWMCMIFLVGYAAWIIVQRHPGLVEFLKLRGPLAALRRWWDGTWRDTSQWMQYAAQVVARSLMRPARSKPGRWPTLRLGRLAPRELVRYFYLSTIQRASKQGIGRKVGQTPYEYSAALLHMLPDSQDDLSQLTDAFVVSQYGRQIPNPHEIKRVRSHWERLRRRLFKAGNAANVPSDSSIESLDD